MLTSLLLASSLLSAAQVEAPQDQTPQPRRPSLEQLERIIDTRTPRIRIDQVDHDRIAVRRIDIVDEDGTIRMTLAADTPAPIIDGIQYRRAFGVSGLILYDENGSERGGFGVADVDGGLAVLALDHPAMDAIGWRVSPDGSVSFVINQAPPLIRDPGLDNRLVPGVSTPTRIRMQVAADGTPSVGLADANDKTRVRMTVTPEGYGAIEFLNADGEVIHTMAPEADATR